jgi:hypothetical protein
MTHLPPPPPAIGPLLPPIWSANWRLDWDLNQDSDWSLDWTPVGGLGFHLESHRRLRTDIAHI